MPPPEAHEWRDAARQLGDGEELPHALHESLCREIAGRADRVLANWSLPEVGPLRICKHALPDWWLSGGNLVLLGEGVDTPNLLPGMLGGAATNSLLIVGRGTLCNQFTFAGCNNLMMVGEGCQLPTTGLSTLSGGTMLIGEATTSTFLAQLDCRNGGAILTGKDGMWAAGVRMITDDMHAIRRLETNERLNDRGGRIVIQPHVWLGEHVIVMGGALIGTDTVVGAASIVRRVSLPSNSVCVGSPARVVRSDITWTREDAP